MNDRIHTMRTYFWRPGHQVDTVTFARGVLHQQQISIQRQLNEAGFIPTVAAELMAVELGDPSQPANGVPLVAYINQGNWLARCECGGVEFVDDGMPLFMCCSCWNAAHGHRWRAVSMPRIRSAIERVLLARPAANRNWRGESLVVLKRENAEHGIQETV